MPGTPTSRGWTTLSTADAADIEQVNVPLNEIDADVTAVETALEAADTTLDTTLDASLGWWRSTFERFSYHHAGLAGGVIYVLGTDPTGGSGSLNDPLPSEPFNSFYINTTDLAATGKTTKVRLRGTVFVNAVAPGTTATFALYPITGWGGASGSVPTVSTIGAAVTSVTLPSVSLVAGLPLTDASTEVTVPATGHYLMGVTFGAPLATGSALETRAVLQVRHT